MKNKSLLVSVLLVLFAAESAVLGQSQKGDSKTLPGSPRNAYEIAWPNPTSKAISDPWISKNHAKISQMRPRVLVVNFANGIGIGGNDQLDPNQKLTEELLRNKVEGFFRLIREGSRFQPNRNPEAKSFIEPELVKIVDLRDRSPHVNSQRFPRGQSISNTPGYRTVGYYHLFGDEYSAEWGFKEKGRFLNLAELVERGLIHDVIMIANQVDGRAPNPPDQVTSNILEVAFVAQAYDVNRVPIPGEFVKNGIPFERQKIDMSMASEHDHNSMPWIGRSLRIYFLNVSRGPGCLLHSLAHDLEFRYNESRIYAPNTPLHEQNCMPSVQPFFREFAGFDFRKRYGAPFNSLYELGDKISYQDTDGDGICDLLFHAKGKIPNFDAMGGNCHYAPGSSFGYDYQPKSKVWSSMETYRKRHSKPQPMDAGAWKSMEINSDIDGDCGGKFLTFWMQNMPGYKNDCIDDDGKPLLNWWPYMYY